MNVVISTKERTYIEFDQGFLNNITHMGKLNYSGVKPPLPAHKHNKALEICYVHRGNPVFYVDGREYNLKGGDIFLSFPDEIHSTGGHPLDRMILYWIGIRTEDIRDNFLGFYDRNEGESLRKALCRMKTRQFRGSDRYKGQMEEMLRLYFSDDEFRTILIRNRLSDFLISVIEMEKADLRPTVSPLINHSIEFIQDNIGDRIPLGRLAELSGLSLPRFKQRFKEETGIPPGEYILRHKIKQAERELAGTDREITLIAFDLEFSSSQYFATVFRRYTGCSPSEYRKRTSHLFR